MSALRLVQRMRRDWIQTVRGRVRVRDRVRVRVS